MALERFDHQFSSGMPRKRPAISPAAPVAAALVIMLFAGSEARGPISLGINRRAPASTLASARTNQLRRKLSEEGSNKGAVGVTGIHDCENLQYTSAIDLGTPPQEMKVTLSTGSYDLWVASIDCETCGATTGYDSSISSTYEADGEEFTVDDGAGLGGAGFLSVDKLTLAGLSTTVTFGEMITADLVQGCDEVDGLMGMGLSNEDGQNAFEDMLDAGVIDVPVFSFFMGNVDEGTPNGILTLGGVNQTHYEGCLEWVDVSTEQIDFPDGYWSVVLKDVKLGSESMLKAEATAVIDSGASLIIGPSRDVGELAGKLGAFCVRFEGLDSSEPEPVDCVEEFEEIELILMECSSQFDNINFFFGGDDFSFTPEDLLQPVDDFGPQNPSTAADPWCLFGMTGADMEDTWIFGDSFLRSFYTAYNVDDRTVGLAPATSGRQGDECAADANLGVAHPFQRSSSGSGTEKPRDTVTDSVPSSSHDSSVSKASHSSSSSGAEKPGDTVTDSAPSSSHDSSISKASHGGSSTDHEDNDDKGESKTTTTGSGEVSSDQNASKKDQPSMFAVVLPAVVGTIILFAAVVGLMLLGRQLWAGRQYRHAPLGDGMGGHEGGGGGGRGTFEMADNAIRRARHGDEIPGPEDDFLQAGGIGRESAGGKRVVRTGDDEVEVDLGGMHRGGRGASEEGGKAGVFGRLLSGPSGEGFAVFDNKDEGPGIRAGGRQGDV